MTGATWPGVPFRTETSEEVLEDLRDRLRRTRFPGEQAGPDWQTGTPLGYARRLRDFWLNEFDWRAWEARINAFEQRMIEVDGQTIHVIVEQGSGDNPLPLVLTDGWPGSFLEFIDLIGPLAHPERFGGRVEDAFTVVAPSLPGYGFSPAPARPLSPTEIAALWSKLMTEQFGFAEYGAYGSDWGSLVTAKLALDHPAGLRGILLTSQGMTPAVPEDKPVTPEEAAWQKRAHERMYPESGYQLLQGTKPQSLAYGHADSPIALACWVIEKFHGWTVNGSAADPPFAMDDLIANVMLYWINGATAPMWLYLFLNEFYAKPETRRASVPAGFLLAPHDMVAPAPRSWIERVFDVAHYRVAESGGHFLGMDNAELLLDELREFFHRVIAPAPSQG